MKKKILLILLTLLSVEVSAKSTKLTGENGDLTGYTQLDHLTFNGGYLVTDVYMKSTVFFQMKMRPLFGGGGAYLGCSISDDDNHDYRFFMVDGDTYIDVMDSRCSGRKLNMGVAYELEFGNNYLKDLTTNETLLSGDAISFDYSGNSDALISVCGANDKATYYYLKVYDDNVLIRDYIPCQRDADGAFGFYDKLNNTFTPIEGENKNTATAIDGIWYELNTTTMTAEVSNETGDNNSPSYFGNVEIPSTVTLGSDIYNVTAIRSNAFSGCSDLSSITIPSSVTTIESGAFSGCDNMLVVLQNTTPISIPRDCFSQKGCLMVPNDCVETYAAAQGWKDFVSIIPYEEPTIITFADPNVKAICVEHWDSDGDGELSTWEAMVVSNIDSYSQFYFNEQIVSFDEFGFFIGIKSINSYTFSGCPSLTSLVIPNSVVSIDYGAIYDCNNLTSLSLGNKVESIGDEAFSGCPSLTSLVIPNSVVSIGHRAFYDCNNLTSLSLGNKVESIGDEAFSGCPSLTSLVIPNSVVSIGHQAFYDCNNLTSLSLGNKVESIGDEAFSGCPSLTSLVIPNSVVSIGNNAFRDGSCITSVTIPQSVTSIGINPFQNCSNLTSISVESGNTVYDSRNNCNAIIKSQTNALVSGCSTTIIPDNVASIEENAFYGCNTLQFISIPSSVENIGNSAFDMCTALKKMVLEDGMKSLYLSNNTFSGSPIDSLYLGRNMQLGYDGTVYWQRTFNGNCLNSVEMSNKVKTVPAGMFAACDNIQNVKFYGTIGEWCEISFGNQDATPMGHYRVEYGGGSSILYLNDSPLHSQVNIPEGVTKIGSYSFWGQNGVSTFIVPSTVQIIEPNAFNADYVSEVTINASSVIQLSETSAFTTNTAIHVKDELLYDYREADVWKDISEQIFPAGFKQVTVDLVAMSSSPALLPALNALEVVNGEYRISALTNLKIRGTMNGWDILMIRNKMPNLRCLDLQEATILDNDGGMEYYQGCHTTANTISEYCFYNLKNLHTVVLPENITSIRDHAFAESGIQTVTIPGDSLKSISGYSFYNSNLQSIIIPGSVKSIGSRAFQNCGFLVNVTICDGVESMEDYAFYNCTSLRDLTIGKGLKSIGRSAFNGCTSIEKLILPTTLENIGYGSFSDCYSLSRIDFAEGLLNIGANAFSNCTKLKELHLPTSLRRIESRAFQSCSGLTEVHVPSMISEIGDYAFNGCGLKSVYAYTVVPVQINQNTFDYTGVDLYAPSNSFYAYYLNTQWSQFLDVKEFDALYTNWYTPRNTDLEINVSKPIKNLDDENPADGNMEAGSGLIFVGDGEQLVKKLILNWNHGANYPSLIENGNLSVEELSFILNVYPGRWYFFSFPFDVKLKDIKHDGKWVWRYYDGEARAENGSGGWKDVEGDVLKANQGYIFQCNTAGDLELPVDNPEFTQAIAGSTEKDVPLQSIEAANPQDASWNFVGNPNLSYYGLDDMAEDFDAPITVWDAEQQTYTAVVPGDDDYDFHPFEAYFVQTPENVANITFDDENRSTYTQTEKKAANRARCRLATSVDEKRMLVNLTVTDGKTTDKTRIIFNDDNKLDYEAGRDANKFMSMAEVPQIYTLDGRNVKYSVNARPNGNREVRLGFVASADGNYTIAVDRMDFRMALKDNQTGTIHQLDGGAYTFYSDAGTFDNRFNLIPGTEVTSINSKGIDGLNIVTIDNGLVVTGAYDGDVNIYKTNGIKVSTLQGSGTVKLTSGTYIVSYAGNSTKILVK